MKPDVRKVLMDQATALEGDSAAVLLSAGIDSASIMFALLEAGKKVRAYSFTLDDRESTDFQLARRNAEAFGVEFSPIYLPTTDMDAFKADLSDLAQLGARKKTDFECGWPMLYAYAKVDEGIVCSGMGADGHFCISKKGMIHYRHRIDDFRRALFTSSKYAQQPIHFALADRYRKRTWMPYLTTDMHLEFLGTSWAEVNKPKQKQPILDAFPEQFAKMKVLPHTNLQLGDSGIAEHFQKLLDTDWNVGGKYKSVVGIYNRIVEAHK